MRNEMLSARSGRVNNNRYVRALIHCGMAAVAAAGLCTASSARAQDVEPFTFRAPVDPYSVFLLPDFMIHSRERSDIIIQRSVFSPGVGGWHTHPGVSFAYVLQGHLKLQKYARKGGCYETPVYGPGEVYIKPPNELHRAVVMGSENEVELIVRLNFPEGGPIGVPAADPGCAEPSTFSMPQAASVSPLAPDDADALVQALTTVAPFNYRGTLPGFQVHQLPDFLMHSQGPSDIIFQRTTFAHGPGAWHTHPGPSFVIVLEGQMRLQKFDSATGCYETPVYGPGEGFIEYGQQIHRPVVVSEGSAKVLLARFNVPVGGPASTPVVPAPPCPD